MIQKLTTKTPKVVPLYVQHNAQKQAAPAPVALVLQNLLSHKLCITSLDQIIVLDLSDIIYCHAYSNYTTIYTTGNQKYLVSKTLSWVENKISNSLFLRVHQSYLINADKVVLLDYSDGLKIVLKEAKSQIPVSRANQKMIKTIFS